MLSNDKNFNFCDISDMVEEELQKPYEIAYSLVNFLGENTGLLTEVIRGNKANVFKSGVTSWPDLANELLIELDHIPNISQEFLEYRNKIRDAFETRQYAKLKEILANENWCIDSNNEMAIKFDKSVRVLNHYIY